MDQLLFQPDGRSMGVAAQRVTLVPLDVTMSSVLEESHRQELLAADHPVPQAQRELVGVPGHATLHGGQSTRNLPAATI
ncbi:hypothetical protein ACQCSU_16705 [Pseudarthrobacter sp. O4]|uniref:hypothetical protein n=1 Tax=Pseudarthrobacter sp. O4 TaxID=3418417 RepID=UPI003CE8851A